MAARNKGLTSQDVSGSSHSSPFSPSTPYWPWTAYHSKSKEEEASARAWGMGGGPSEGHKTTENG